MKPNTWKMVLLVWSAMFPFSTIVSYALAQMPFIASWPLVARTFCLTCLLVPFMVCLALPFLTRRFQGWLQQNSPSAQTPPVPSEPLPVDQSGTIRSETNLVPHQQYAI